MEAIVAQADAATNTLGDMKLAFQRVSHDQQFPQIERRSNLSLQEFKHEYLYPQKPLVITDATAGWAATQKWTFEFFRTTYGDYPVRVYRYDQEQEFRGDAIVETTIRDYVDNVSSKNWSEYPFYLRDNWRLLHDHSELKADYREAKYFFDWYRLFPSALRMPYPRVFLGPKGAVTPLHSDVWGTHAWLAQLVGRKRWILFSPDQVDLHYGCKVRVDAPDLGKYPRYAQVHPIETTLAPGDTIFVPSRWAHWVVSLDATISLTGNYMAYGCFSDCLANSAKDLGRRIAGRMGGPG